MVASNDTPSEGRRRSERPGGLLIGDSARSLGHVREDSWAT
jgi:hypothetical protein